MRSGDLLPLNGPPAIDMQRMALPQFPMIHPRLRWTGIRMLQLREAFDHEL